MHVCRTSQAPVDRELHAAGCCRCALYPATRPPQRRLTPAEANHLLGLFGFQLEQLADGRYLARDPLRGLQVPDGAGLPSTAHPEEDLGGLVVRARCADRLAGPLTIAEATAALAALGFELKRRDHRTSGRQWWATSQELAVATGEWSHLKDVLAAARCWRAQAGYRQAHQPDLPTLTEQVPRDLDPKPRARATPGPAAGRGRRRSGRSNCRSTSEGRFTASGRNVLP